MKPNEKDQIFLVVKTVFIAIILASVTSCSSFKRDKLVNTEYVNLIDSSRDTIFSIANRKQYDNATITLKGTLSDTSVISFSTDTLLQKTTFFVPETGNNFFQVLNLESIRNDSLFIKYHPTKGSIFGYMKIAVTFL